MKDQEALIGRVEGAKEESRELFLEVWRELFPRASFASGRESDAARNKMLRFAEVGAWHDAAMMMLPFNGSMNLTEVKFSWEQDDAAVYPAAVIRWYPPHKSGPDWHALIETAATLPLTLLVCALRARLRTDPAS